MNNDHKDNIRSASVHAEDAQHEIEHGQRWLAAIFRAIQRAPKDDGDAAILAEIGQYHVERSAGIALSDIANLQRSLHEVAP